MLYFCFIWRIYYLLSIFRIICKIYPVSASWDVYQNQDLASAKEESRFPGIIFFPCNCIIPAKQVEVDVYAYVCAKLVKKLLTLEIMFAWRNWLQQQLQKNFRLNDEIVEYLLNSLNSNKACKTE